MLDLPSPQPVALGRVAPTVANDLLTCAYRVAWRLDPRFKGLRRPNPWSELGVVAHSFVEDMAKGLLTGIGSEAEARAVAERAWSRHVAERRQDLAAAWNPATPPPPEEWPGYYLTRARVLRRALQKSRLPASSVEPSTPTQVEKEFEDEAYGLFGRPDRVEGPLDDRSIIDLKSGLAQGAATPAQRRQLLMYAHLVQVTEGQAPKRMAIQDPSGRLWEEPVNPDEVASVLSQVQERRAEFQSVSANGGDLSQLASPDADTCRHCAYRVVCRPYWSTLEVDWGHGSVAGTIERATTAPAGSIIEVRADSPIDEKDRVCVVTAVQTAVAVDTHIAIVDAELTGAREQLRWRWSTIARMS